MAIEGKNGEIATAEGMAQVRAEWIRGRREEAARTGDENLSQMHYGRRGVITGEMEYVAQDRKSVV